MACTFLWHCGWPCLDTNEAAPSSSDRVTTLHNPLGPSPWLHAAAPSEQQQAAWAAMGQLGSSGTGIHRPPTIQELDETDMDGGENSVSGGSEASVALSISSASHSSAAPTARPSTSAVTQVPSPTSPVTCLSPHTPLRHAYAGTDYDYPDTECCGEDMTPAAVAAYKALRKASKRLQKQRRRTIVSAALSVDLDPFSGPLASTLHQHQSSEPLWPYTHPTHTPLSTLSLPDTTHTPAWMTAAVPASPTAILAAPRPALTAISAPATPLARLAPHEKWGAHVAAEQGHILSSSTYVRAAQDLQQHQPGLLTSHHHAASEGGVPGAAQGELPAEVASQTGPAQGCGRPAGDLTIVQKIGQGAFGAVFEGMWQGMRVAVKILTFNESPMQLLPASAQGRGGLASSTERSSLGGSKMARMAVMEMAVSGLANHPNLVPTYQCEVRCLPAGHSPDSGFGHAASPSPWMDSGSAMHHMSGKLAHLHHAVWELRLIMAWCDRGTLRDIMQQTMTPQPLQPAASVCSPRSSVVSTRPWLRSASEPHLLRCANTQAQAPIRPATSTTIGTLPPSRMSYTSLAAADSDPGHLSRVLSLNDTASVITEDGQLSSSSAICELAIDQHHQDQASISPHERMCPCGWTYDAVVRTALDIARGLAALHANNIVHTDLKSANVMISSDSQDPRGWIARLGDYGLAVRLPPGTLFISGVYHGSPAYQAPEVRSHGKVFKSSDTYSFGILLWELYTGRCLAEELRSKGFVSDMHGGQFRGLRGQQSSSASTSTLGLGSSLRQIVPPGQQSSRYPHQMGIGSSTIRSDAFVGGASASLLRRRSRADKLDNIKRGFGYKVWAPVFPLGTPIGYETLVRSCLQGNPFTRPTFTALVQDLSSMLSEAGPGR